MTGKSGSEKNSTMTNAFLETILFLVPPATI